MNKTIKITLAVIFVMGASSLFAQDKFARINTQDIISAMPEMTEVQANIQAFVKDLQDNLETINVEYNTKLQDYQKNFKTMSDSVRQLKEQELTSIAQRRDDFQQMAQDDVQKKQNELLAPVIEKAKNAIDKMAKAGGYLAVFDTSAGALVYFNETSLTDLAPAVKKELGIKDTPAAVTTTPAKK